MEQQSTSILGGLSRKLAEFSVNLSLNTVPQRALDNAKLAILDCLGVAVLAASQEVGEKLIRFAGGNAAPCLPARCRYAVWNQHPGELPGHARPSPAELQEAIQPLP